MARKGHLRLPTDPPEKWFFRPMIPFAYTLDRVVHTKEHLVFL